MAWETFTVAKKHNDLSDAPLLSAEPSPLSVKQLQNSDTLKRVRLTCVPTVPSEAYPYNKLPEELLARRRPRAMVDDELVGADGDPNSFVHKRDPTGEKPDNRPGDRHDSWRLFRRPSGGNQLP